MNGLTDERSKVLAEHNDWSFARAEGYVDGKSSRRRGKPPSQYALIGMDEYSLGFRAGYFDRKNAGASRADPASLFKSPRSLS